MLNDSLKRFRHMPKDTIIWLKCNTVSTQTSLYRCFFFRVCLEMLITTESLVKILDTNTYFETVLLYLTLLLSLCLERVFVFFHEYCTENLIQNY